MTRQQLNERIDKRGNRVGPTSARSIRSVCCSPDKHGDHLLFAEAASNYNLRSGHHSGQGSVTMRDGLYRLGAA